MTKKYLGSLCLAALVVVSCQKKQLDMPQAPLTVDQRLIYQLPVTNEEKALVENIKKVSEVLKTVYQKKENVALVNVAILTKPYTDEAVLLRDLIFPESSHLNNWKPLKKRFAEAPHLSISNFAADFWKVAKARGDQDFLSFLIGLEHKSSPLTKGSIGGPDVTIYYPYSDPDTPQEPNWDEIYYGPIVTVVASTADADQGLGDLPWYQYGSFQGYTSVLVDDDYAMNNPTHIVGVVGIEPYGDEPPVTNAAFPPEPPIQLPGIPRQVKQVYVGDVKCTKQYDALISFTGNGGGSEIRFTRADGYLKFVDGQVQADMYIVGDNTISRYAIRKKRWVDFSHEWDGDWETDNLQQNLAIYEEDNRNSSTFNASVTTTLTVPPVTTTPTAPGSTTQAPIGFTINFKSDDYLIKQTNLNRDVFFVLNRTNLEGEMHNGWPVRDKNANVSFTLNDRTYIP